MKLPTPDCPRCHRATEDRGDHFACPVTREHPWPAVLPGRYYLRMARVWAKGALNESPRLAYTFGRWAARCAFRLRPELREP